VALLGVQGEGVAVDERLGDVGVVLVRLTHSEVGSFAVEALQVVEAQAGAGNGVAALEAGEVEGVVGGGLALALDGPDEFEGRVVEVDLGVEAAVAGGGGVLLHLGDELLERADGEAVALFHVQVDVGRVEQGVHVVGRDGLTVVAADDLDAFAVRHLDQFVQGGEAHVHVQGVELQGDERQGVAGVAGEVEGQGHVQAARELRVGHQLREREPLADHFLQALPRLARQLLPHVQVVRVHRVDDLPTDGERRAGDGGEPDLVHPVRVRPRQAGAVVDVVEVVVEQVVVHEHVRLRDRRALALFGGVVARVAWVCAWEAGIRAAEAVATHDAGRYLHRSNGRDINQNIHPINKITRAVQLHRHLRAPRGLPRERLQNRLHCEVRALLDPQAPERHIRIRGQMSIGGAQGNHLG